MGQIPPAGPTWPSWNCRIARAQTEKQPGRNRFLQEARRHFCFSTKSEPPLILVIRQGLSRPANVIGRCQDFGLSAFIVRNYGCGKSRSRSKAE